MVGQPKSLLEVAYMVPHVCRYCALFLTICLGLSSCADWRTYEFGSPPEIKLVPERKLQERVSDKEDRWSRRFAEVIHHLHAWKPNICAMTTIKNTSHDEDLSEISDADLYKSYVRAVPYYMRLDNDENLKAEDVTDFDPAFLLHLHCPREASHFGHMSEEDMRRIVERNILARIDEDHDRLLLPRALLSDLSERSFDWRRATDFNNREITLSRHRPGALTVSVRKAKVPEVERAKPFFLQLQGAGQEGIAKFAESMALTTCAEAEGDAQAKSKCLDHVRTLKDLLSALRAEGQDDTDEDFDSRQAFELQISSMLNSPDILNRFLYLSTYVFIPEYPMPTNPSVNLSQAFWDNFKARQAVRSPSEKQENREADLDSAWDDLRVKFVSAETTVHAPDLEIATVTRDADQKIAITGLKPSVTLAGTIKGSIEAQGELSSSLNTKVAERLITQLDQRSSWLNSWRNLLRITQRGVEAVNVAGTLRENITLEVPSDPRPFAVVELQNKHSLTLKKKRLRQPLYGHVDAFAVTLAVIRDPSELKRSATEKYGLSESMDAYWVVTVSNPIVLKVWEWARVMWIVTLSELVGQTPTDAVAASHVPLRFYDPATNSTGYFIIDKDKARETLSEIKASLANIHDGERILEPIPATDANGTVYPGEYYLQALKNDSEKHPIIIGQGYEGEGEVMKAFGCEDIPFLLPELIFKGICPYHKY